MKTRKTIIIIRFYHDSDYWWDGHTATKNPVPPFRSWRTFRSKRKAIRVLMNLPAEALAYIEYIVAPMHGKRDVKFYVHPDNNWLLANLCR